MATKKAAAAELAAKEINPVRTLAAKVLQEHVDAADIVGCGQGTPSFWQVSRRSDW